MFTESHNVEDIRTNVWLIKDTSETWVHKYKIVISDTREFDQFNYFFVYQHAQAFQSNNLHP